MVSLPTTLNTRIIGSRDILWLSAGFLLASLPHLLRMPIWISVLAIAIAGWRLLQLRIRSKPAAKWLMVLIAFAASVGILMQYRTLFGRDAGVALLVIMLALKLLETRNQRDGMLLNFLGCFLLVTNFLHSQTIPTAVYMLGCAWLLVASLIGMQYTGAWPGWRQPVRRAGVLILQGIPLMLVLFLLFPRLQGPLWGLPQDAYAGLSGLSDNMSPGSLNSLILSDAVAFRATFSGKIPEPKDLYWRGPVLWDYDGKTWTAPRIVQNTNDLPDNGAQIEYTVTVEPHNKRWLFALEFPGIRPPRSIATRDMQLLSFTPVRSRLRYDMTSSIGTAYGADDDRSLLERNLRLPADTNPRTHAFAQDLRKKFPNDRNLVADVLTRFRNENFVYTLSPPLLGGHPVDEFLFETRRGFCEHYASAFTVLMRAAGIPARVVTGYLGGEINPVGEYILVRQADAHAWAEIWLENTGWVRVDPTAAVSPARVERGIASALPRSDPLPMFVRGDFALLQRMRLTLDSVTYTWNQWVLGYTPDRQRRLLSYVGFSEATWQNLAFLLMFCAGVAILIGAGFALRDLRGVREDAVKKIYTRFCRKLEQRGLLRDPAEGPRVFAQRAAQQHPELTGAVNEITTLYVALRYGGESGASRIQDFKNRVRTFLV
ncbi:MAG: transglutaminase TgpA family protein [Betaproteobacteria bacterium]